MGLFLNKIRAYYNQNKGAINFSLLTFLVWRLALVIFSYFGSLRIINNALREAPTSYHFLNPWIGFDSGHYLSIVNNWYKTAEQAAFFPLYPLLVKIIGLVVNNNYIAGLLVANIAFIIALFILYKLLRLKFEEDFTRRVIFYLLIFPTAFFFGSMYSESLFLLLVVSSFYLIKKKSYLSAAVIISLAVLTRSIGIIIIPALIWQLWRQHSQQTTLFNIKKVFSVFTLPIVSFVGWLVYLKNTYGDYFAFINIQNTWPMQHREVGLISSFTNFYESTKSLFTLSAFTEEYAINLVDYGLFILFLFFAIYIFFKMNKVYGLYMFLLLIPVFFSGSLVSVDRYVLVLFPAFILLARWGKNIYVHQFVTILSLLMLGLFTALFANGWWVG